MSVPRLCRADFLSYVRAFNTRDYAHQHSFYAPKITLTLPDPAIPPLHGSEAITAHYSGVHSVAQETLVPIVVMNDSDHVFFLMEVYFVYTQDTNQGVHGREVRVGDVFKVTVWALYEIDEAGKMATIRCNLWEEKMYGQVDVQPLIEQSRARAQVDLR